MKNDNTDSLIEMMFRTFRLLKGEMSFTKKLTHLSILQIQALVFVKFQKRVSMSDIADNFHIELPSATSLLKKLSEQKLVEREEDRKDRRIVLVKLTEKGRALLEEALKERRKKLEKVLSYLSEKERRELMSILKTLQNKLEKK